MDIYIYIGGEDISKTAPMCMIFPGKVNYTNTHTIQGLLQYTLVKKEIFSYLFIKFIANWGFRYKILLGSNGLEYCQMPMIFYNLNLNKGF